MLSYPLFEHPPYTLALASRLCQIAAEQALDIVHMHYAIPHTVSAYLARELPVPSAARTESHLSFERREPCYPRIASCWVFPWPWLSS